MQKQQDRVLMIITLAGLGLIGAVFGLVSWLIDGGSLPDAPIPSNGTISGISTAPDSGMSQLSAVEEVPQGMFNYGGSTTWVPVHEPLSQSISSTFPDFNLRYTLPSSGSPGSGTGIKMLLEGQLSFSESSRALKPEEIDAAEQRNFVLEQVPVAIDGIAVAVNPEIGVAGLSMKQIRAIYTGEVSNWLELGGPDLPIQAYSRSPEESGTAEFFLELVLEADTYSSDVKFISDTTTAIRQVASEVGAIYFASAPEVVDQCSIYAIPIAPQDQPNDFVPPFEGVWRTGNECLEQANTINKIAFRDGEYPLTRRLFVIVKADGAADETAGRAYVDMLRTDEGQSIFEAAGFVSIR